MNPEDGKPCVDEYRFILWLRESDPNFEQDFGMLTGKLLPPDKELLLGVVLPGQEDQLEYLRTVQPLWPEFPLGDAPAV